MKRLDGQAKRRDGVNGLSKGPCPYVNTGWAWWKENTDTVGGPRGCTCSPCSPPKRTI